MANWKKVVVSGSSAELSALTLDTSLASGSGGTGLSKSVLANATAGQVLAIKTDLSGFTLADATSGDVKTINTPTNGGLSISDTSGTDGNVAITMSISDLATETTLASGDTFAFDDISDTTSAVTTKKVTLNVLSGSIISGIAGDVNVSAGGVSTIQDNKITDAMLQRATTGSILATITGDVSVDAGGVSTLATSVGVLGTNEFTGSFKGDGSDLTNISISTISDALTGSILATIAGDVDVTEGGVSTIGSNKVTIAMVADATTGSILATIAGDVDVDAAGVSTIGSNKVVSSMLDTSISITDNLTVGGNLNVAGTASFTNATNLAVSDKYILLNSGSGQADDSGGIIIQGPNQGIGQLFGFASGSVQRWGVDSNFNADTAAGFTAEAFMSAVVEGGSGVDTPALVASPYTSKGNIFVGDNEDIYIYS